MPEGNSVEIVLSDPGGSVLFTIASLQSGAIPRTPEETGIDTEEERSWGTIKALYR